MNDLATRLLKNSPTKNASILSKSAFFMDKDVIPTELPILNIAFSAKIDGGLVSGLTTIAGESRSFKTALSLYCVKAYLDRYEDAVCVFYDSEGGATPDYLKANGIDPSRVIHIPIEHIEMLKFDMVKTLKEIDRKDHVIMLVDSIGNTASLKELEDAENEKSVAEMQRAKSLKALFRMVTPALISKDVPCICIAHTYKTMELYSKNIISGGTGILYSSNQAFIITRSQEKDGKDLKGWNFTINIEKSRYVREKEKLVLNVMYDTGINKWSGLLEIALDSGHVIKPNMGWYSRVNMETGEIEEKKYREKDTYTSNFWTPIITSDSFKEYVEKRFSVTQGSLMQEDDIEEVLDSIEEE